MKKSTEQHLRSTKSDKVQLQYTQITLLYIINNNVFPFYWVVQKVRADFEGKLKRRRFKF